MRDKIELHALHGFLGKTGDWDPIFSGRLPSNVCKVNSHDLYACYPSPLNHWGNVFNQSLGTKSSKTKRVLVGYSLGGRLGLHALIENPQLWDAAVILSANPGLTNRDAIEKRLKSDLDWANRFMNEPWDQVMDAWNDQSVLRTSQKIERKENHYRREHLVHTLKEWSLGKQDDLRMNIKQLPLPILWLVGENDPEYIKHLTTLHLSHPHAKKSIVADAGHRIPWDKPEHFCSLLTTFLTTL